MRSILYPVYLNPLEVLGESLLQRRDGQLRKGILVLVHLPLHKPPLQLLGECGELDVGGRATLVGGLSRRLLLQDGWHGQGREGGG